MQKTDVDDDVADILVFAGRADNWFDIYKTLELVEEWVGRAHHLQKLLGKSYEDYKTMKATAKLLSTCQNIQATNTNNNIGG